MLDASSLYAVYTGSHHSRTSVKIDCSRRFNKTILRKATGVPGNYHIGDTVMYQREQKEKAPEAHVGDRWQGPVRITGFDGEVVWMTDSGLSVCGATHLIRPPNGSEMLSMIVCSRHYTPSTEENSTRTEDEQRRYADIRQTKSVGPPPTEN